MANFNVGDIVTHAARKTIKFQITEQRDRSFTIRRVEQVGSGYAINQKFRGYTVPLSDVGNLKLVNASGSVKLDPTVKTYTIEELRSNPFLSKNIVNEFFSLAVDMSPENVTCDGMLSASEVRKKMNDLRRRWALLEQYLQLKVSEEI